MALAGCGTPAPAPPDFSGRAVDPPPAWLVDGILIGSPTADDPGVLTVRPAGSDSGHNRILDLRGVDDTAPDRARVSAAIVPPTERPGEPNYGQWIYGGADPAMIVAGAIADVDTHLPGALSELVSGKRRTAEVLNRIAGERARYPAGALTVRPIVPPGQAALDRYGVAALEGILRLAMALPGTPLVGALPDSTVSPALAGAVAAALNLRGRFPALRRGGYRVLPVTQIAGAAGAFLREKGGEVVLVLANPRPLSARQVLVPMPDSLIARYPGLRLHSVDDPDDAMAIDSVYVSALLPFAVRLYAGQSGGVPDEPAGSRRGPRPFQQR